MYITRSKIARDLFPTSKGYTQSNDSQGNDNASSYGILSKYKIIDIQNFIDVYGENITLKEIRDIFKKERLSSSSEVKEKEIECFKCPKCFGKGFITHKFEEDINAWGYGTPPPTPPIDEKCDVCDGEGYTSKKLKPIIKTEIIGYE